MLAVLFKYFISFNSIVNVIANKRSMPQSGNEYVSHFRPMKINRTVVCLFYFLKKYMFEMKIWRRDNRFIFLFTSFCSVFPLHGTKSILKQKPRYRFIDIRKLVTVIGIEFKFDCIFVTKCTLLHARISAYLVFGIVFQTILIQFGSI